MQHSVDRRQHSGLFGRLDSGLPQVFGRYLLVQRLSRGGMGELFLAKHGLAGFEKLAVIKKVLPHLAADEQFIARFVDEAQVAIKLQHVNVAQVFEVGRVGDEYFLALEYIEGRDLRRTLSLLAHQQRRLPVDLALFIARELANGLAYAHRRTTADGASLHLVHCDISPPNVVVSFEGETKVIDFGIAKSAMRGSTTDPKIGFGKFGYMAPEQLIRGAVVDHRTDIYAAGVVLFELLTGTRLYESGSDPDYRALAKKVSRGDHPMPSDIDRALAPYDALVRTALRPSPDDRYRSAAELRDAIQHCLVAVNPTISTDQLGAFMRALFADEMTAQRELHDRIAHAHIADYQEQFHTQTIATVSFALAQLPMHSPDATGRIVRGTRRPASALDAMDEHPAAIDSAAERPAALDGPHEQASWRDPLDGPHEQASWRDPRDATRGGVNGPALPDRRGRERPLWEDELAAAEVTTADRRVIDAPRRWLVIGATAAIVLLTAIGVGGVALLRGTRRSAAPAPVPARVDQRSITVEPIPVEPDPLSADAVAESVTALPAAQPPAPAPTHRPPHRPTRRVAAASAAITREQLGQKFRQVRRAYDAYKARFGSRLEREWGELATFIQYMPEHDDDAGRKEAARRLDAFNARMRD